MFKKKIMEEEEEPPRKLLKLAVIKNVVSQQLGIRVNQSLLNYYTTLNALQNLKPSTALVNAPTVLNKQISDIQFNSKGNLLANAYWGNDTIQIWDWSNVKLQAFFSSGHNFTVRQVNWVPADTENLIVTSSQYGDIRLMDLNSSKKTSRLLENPYVEDDEHFWGGFRFCINANLPYTVLAGSQKGKIVNIDIRADKSTELILVKNENSTSYDIDSIDINPAKCSEFCVGGSKDIRIYDCRNLSNPVQKFHTKPHVRNHILHNDVRRILTVKYSYNGSEILVAYSDDPAYLFNTLRPKPIKTYETIRQNRSMYKITIYNVYFIGGRSEFVVASTSNSSSLAGGQTNNLYIWDKDSGELVHEIQMEERSWRFAPHPHMPILAMNLNHSGIRLWQ